MARIKGPLGEGRGGLLGFVQTVLLVNDGHDQSIGAVSSHRCCDRLEGCSLPAVALTAVDFNTLGIVTGPPTRSVSASV